MRHNTVSSVKHQGWPGSASLCTPSLPLAYLTAHGFPCLPLNRKLGEVLQESTSRRGQARALHTAGSNLGQHHRQQLLGQPHCGSARTCGGRWRKTWSMLCRAKIRAGRNP